MNKWMVQLYNLLAKAGNAFFPGSAHYWESRYKKGKTSGKGSYSRLAEFKARVINQLVQENNIRTLTELGCGDGNQLALYKVPQYIGLDISKTAIEICRRRFAGDTGKSFYVFEPEALEQNILRYHSEATLSADVIYHLVEDKVFEQYMRNLFALAQKYVIIYSSNYEGPQLFHEKDRCFTRWINDHVSGWKLWKKIPNEFPYDPNRMNDTSKSDFYIYRKDFQ